MFTNENTCTPTHLLAPGKGLALRLEGVSRNSQAFTLIELLVVITIIVVLLALLAPALEKAVYQAQLAICAADKHALGVGVSQYAIESKRSYPHRQAVHEPGNWPAMQAWPSNISMGRSPYDDRGKLAPYISLNATLNCPLTPAKIDIANSHPDTWAFSAYNLWFGFRFTDASGQARPGMLRLGDRLEWEDTANAYTLSSTLLAATRYVTSDNANNAYGTHQDDRDSYVGVTLQDQNVAGAQAGGGATALDAKYTWTRWDSFAGRSTRGTVDTNAVFADVSVARYDSVKWDNNDDRMARVPEYNYTVSWPFNWEIVPKQ